MTFKLFSSKDSYHRTDDSDLIVKLQSRGIKFVDHYADPTYLQIAYEKDWQPSHGTIEINSLEDLRTLQKEFGDDPLIIDPLQQTITIYNGHIE